MEKHEMEFTIWYEQVNQILKTIENGEIDTSGHCSFILETIHDHLTEFCHMPKMIWCMMLFLVWEVRQDMDYSAILSYTTIQNFFNESDFNNEYYSIASDVHKLANIVLTGLPILGFEVRH